MHASSARARLLRCEILADVFCLDTIFTADCKLNAENQSFCLYISPSSNSFFSFFLCFRCGSCRGRKVMQMQDSLCLALKAVETFVPFNQELHEQGQKWLTLSLPQRVKFPGRKMRGCACKQYIFWSYSNPLSVLYVFMKILSLASAKKRTKRLKGIRFRTFIGHFWVISWQWRG